MLMRPDRRRDYGEAREISVGQVEAVVVVVVHTWRDGRGRRPARKGKSGMNGNRRSLTPDEIASVDDREIDFSDIPELDATFWREAELVQPDSTQRITLRVKRSVLDHFRAAGRGYQTRINRVLESYVKAQRGSEGQ